MKTQTHTTHRHSTNGRSSGHSVKAAATRTMRRVVNSAEDMAETASDTMSEYKDKAKAMLHSANNTTLADVETGVSRYIRNNPTRTLLGAAAGGILLGFFFCPSGRR